MESAASSAPVLHPAPNRAATAAVHTIETMRPRIVFDRPKIGCSSGSLDPRSSGVASRSFRILAREHRRAVGDAEQEKHDDETIEVTHRSRA